MRIARRVQDLPPYLFAAIERQIAERRAAGVDVISLGIGDPDHPTPPHIVAALVEAVHDPSTHQYPTNRGEAAFREAVAAFYARRFGVDVDPATEVVPLLGAKEGIAHVPRACLNPGEAALVPDPGYPVYRTSVILSGGIPVDLPLSEEDGFLPDLDSVEGAVWDRARMMFINYPNNPTSAVADLSFFEKAVYYARRHEVLLAHDNAYSEITYDGYRAPSLLEVPGAREWGLEFHSLSKTYNMTGWRLGFAVGGERVVAALGKVKTNVDSGVFNAIQLAGVAALEGPQDCVEHNRNVYRRRRDELVNALRLLGWKVEPPRATLYVWMRVPEGHTSGSFTRELLERARVVVVPGAAYGSRGEGYVRFSLTLPDDELREGVRRIREAFS